MGAARAGIEGIAGERGQLINVAYRLLGSLAESEDAVQEAYARWYALPRSRRDEIVSPGAWLTTVTGRICLDVLGSARVRRERYVGAWLPDPLPGPGGHGQGSDLADLADRIVQDESVTMAFLVVLETMTPPSGCRSSCTTSSSPGSSRHSHRRAAPQGPPGTVCGLPRYL